MSGNIFDRYSRKIDDKCKRLSRERELACERFGEGTEAYKKYCGEVYEPARQKIADYLSKKRNDY